MGYSLKRIAPPTENIIELDGAKKHLNVLHSDDDELIEDYIKAATDYLDGPRGALGRCIAPQTWEMYLDEFPLEGFDLPLPPLIEIVEIRYFDSAGSEQTLDESAYRVDEWRTPAWVAPGDAGWPATMKTINAVAVQFRAGWESDESSGNSPIPPTVQQIARQLVAAMYANRGEGSWEVPPQTQELIDRVKVYR